MKTLQQIKDYWDGLVQSSELPALFSPRQGNLKIPINSGLQQAGIVRPRKMTLDWFHQTLY